MSRAAYMREYRAKKKSRIPLELRSTDVTVSVQPSDGEPSEYRAENTTDMIGQLTQRIAFLENDVARLKRELAARPDTDRGVRISDEIRTSFDPGFVAFRPAPKPGKR